MKILVVGITGSNLHLVRLQVEGKKRGHTVDGAFVSDLVIFSDRDNFKVNLKNGLDISSYDFIYLWTLGKRRWEWQIAAKYLAEKYGIVFVNDNFVNVRDISFSPSMLFQFYEQHKEKLPFPKTALIYNTKALLSVMPEFQFPLIVKLADSSKGQFIYKVSSLEELKDHVLKLQKLKGAILVREFIPNVGDIRVFTVGFKAVAAMKRTPKEGDFRSNISQGGTGEAYDLLKYPDIASIAEILSKVTGTEVAGVDIILHKETGKPYILELNPGPQFLGIEKFTGINIAEKIIEYFENKSP